MATSIRKQYFLSGLHNCVVAMTNARFACSAIRRILLTLLAVLAITPLFAQNTSFVDIGLGGFPNFRDRTSGSQSVGTSPAVTVIKVGDSVQWEWHYTHSTTSGKCINFQCTANGIWDSTIQNQGFTFKRTFDTLGTFDYFCLIHLSQMTGQVVVLNGPDYGLKINNNNFGSPIPTMAALAGQQVTFSGTLTGFLGYSNLVNLSCKNGTPRVPDNCPATSATPGAMGTPFSVTVSDSTAGNYTFDIAAIGTDPAQIQHTQQVQLQVEDFKLTAPSVNAVTLLPGTSSPNINFQVTAANGNGFSGFIGLSCSGLPSGTTCLFLQNGTTATNEVFVNSASPPVDVTLIVNNASAAPGVYAVQIVGTSFSFNFPGTRSQPVSVRVIGPATHFSLSGVPTLINAGAPFTLTASASDAAENTVLNYGGTIRFSSSDPAASLPQDYPFVPGDAGQHVFSGLTLNTVGPRNLTVTDITSGAITAASAMIRVENGSPNDAVGITSSRSSTNPPHFATSSRPQDATVSLTATVRALTGNTSPTGVARFFDGVKDLGTAPLTGSGGQATAVFVMDGITHPLLNIGDHTITAVYEPAAGSSFTTNLSLTISQPRSPAPKCNATRCP